VKPVAEAKTVQNCSLGGLWKIVLRDFILAVGAGIRACRQHPRGLSQGGSDDTSVAIEKVTSRIAAFAAVAATSRRFKRKQYYIILN
jgi:hypothetical protein